jgi:hypothetical protein
MDPHPYTDRELMVIAAGREIREHEQLGRLMAGAQLDDVHRQTLALLFPQQLPGTRAR